MLNLNELIHKQLVQIKKNLQLFSSAAFGCLQKDFIEGETPATNWRNWLDILFLWIESAGYLLAYILCFAKLLGDYRVLWLCHWKQLQGQFSLQLDYICAGLKAMEETGCYY